MPKVILKGKDMSHMTLCEQEEVWRLSRANDVFEEDCNGVLWQVLDCTDDETSEEDER